MKQIIALVLILSSLNTLCQKTAADTSVMFFYTQQQRLLYNIANAHFPAATKRVDTYNSLSSFITAHPKQEISFSLIAGAVNLSALQIETLINLTDSSLSKSSFKSSTIVTLRRLQVAETGKLFPKLLLADTLGNITSVEDLRGKIILIDLWSSWCRPCRKQIPGLKKIYNQYKEKGFEIIGISMDSDKADWLKAVINDKQDWKNYCELTTWSQNTTARKFSITAIPSNFLLDKNGIILGQDLSEEQISYLLSKAF